MIHTETTMKDHDKIRNTKAAIGLAVLGVGWTVSTVVLPPEGGAFCRPTEMCAPPPMPIGDEPADNSVPQLFKARVVIGSSVSLSSLSASSVSFRT
jgi:hypothetical protein